MSTQGPLKVGDRVGDATVVQMAEGGGHTAALLSDGRVVCWGENDHGQCAVPPDLGPAVQVAAGRWHTAALLSDGRVVCWGSNEEGQCAVPPDLGPAVQVAAGYSHTATLLADGRTRVWGHWCGVVPWEVEGDHALELLVTSSPALSTEFGNKLLHAVPSGVVKQAVYGIGHKAALLSDGRVLCWGSNGWDQCDVPSDLGPAVQVASGYSHTAALLSDGRVVCWGRNDEEQCAVPPDLGPAVQVAAAESHTATLLADGRTRVWGHWCGGVPWEVEGDHALELLVTSGSALSMYFGNTLLASVPSVVVKQAVTRGEHTAAVLADGRVFCWGSNDRGQCDVPSDLGPAVQVDVSIDHTVVLLADGRVVCWGRNNEEQCAVPPDLGPAVQVAAGARHTAVLLENGRVVCWGENDEKQCAVPPDLGPAVQVAAGGRHTAALLADGRVVCWGDNDEGQCAVPRDLGPAVQVAAAETHTATLLADGRTRVWGHQCGGVPWEVEGDHALELLVTSSPALSRRFGNKLLDAVPSGVVKQVAAGSEHTAVLLPNGRVVCWGGNEEGQCGIPEAIQGRVARVHAEGHGTWAVDVDGRLHGWGVVKEVNSLPFELSDEAWLEFATRMWGKTKQKIYPEHIRKSAAFKAIRTMHKVAGE